MWQEFRSNKTYKSTDKSLSAPTSELYGNGNSNPQNENTPFRPTSPYADAKLYGYWITKIYRKGYKIFACNGILFNHESPLRGLEFVTRKISNAVAKISLGLEKELILGNLESKRDWSYAPDYVKSMWLMLQHKKSDDFVMATNEAHSVKEFCETLVFWKENGASFLQCRKERRDPFCPFGNTLFAFLQKGALFLQSRKTVNKFRKAEKQEPRIWSMNKI